MSRRRGSGLAWIAAVLVGLAASGCESAAPAPALETAELSPPPAEPSPRAGRPPPITHVPRDFTLLYGRGAVEPQLPQADELLRAITQHSLTTRSSCVLIVGHADTVGSSAANMGLSIDRARSLAAVLRDAGVTGPIYYAGRGENDLARPTSEGVDEPLNRRVTVLFLGQYTGCQFYGATEESPYERYPD